MFKTILDISWILCGIVSALALLVNILAHSSSQTRYDPLLEDTAHGAIFVSLAFGMLSLMLLVLKAIMSFS